MDSASHANPEPSVPLPEAEVSIPLGASPRPDGSKDAPVDPDAAAVEPDVPIMLTPRLLRKVASSPHPVEVRLDVRGVKRTKPYVLEKYLQPIRSARTLAELHSRIADAHVHLGRVGAFRAIRHNIALDASRTLEAPDEAVLAPPPSSPSTQPLPILVTFDVREQGAKVNLGAQCDSERLTPTGAEVYLSFTNFRGHGIDARFNYRPSALGIMSAAQHVSSHGATDRDARGAVPVKPESATDAAGAGVDPAASSRADADGGVGGDGAEASHRGGEGRGTAQDIESMPSTGSGFITTSEAVPVAGSGSFTLRFNAVPSPMDYLELVLNARTATASVHPINRQVHQSIGVQAVKVATDDSSVTCAALATQQRSFHSTVKPLSPLFAEDVGSHYRNVLHIRHAQHFQPFDYAKLDSDIEDEEAEAADRLRRHRADPSAHVHGTMEGAMGGEGVHVHVRLPGPSCDVEEGAVGEDGGMILDSGDIPGHDSANKRLAKLSSHTTNADEGRGGASANGGDSVEIQRAVGQEGGELALPTPSLFQRWRRRRFLRFGGGTVAGAATISGGVLGGSIHTARLEMHAQGAMQLFDPLVSSLRLNYGLRCGVVAPLAAFSLPTHSGMSDSPSFKPPLPPPTLSSARFEASESDTAVQAYATRFADQIDRAFLRPARLGFETLAAAADPYVAGEVPLKAGVPTVDRFFFGHALVRGFGPLGPSIQRKPRPSRRSSTAPGLVPLRYDYTGGHVGLAATVGLSGCLPLFEALRWHAFANCGGVDLVERWVGGAPAAAKGFHATVRDMMASLPASFGSVRSVGWV